MAQRPVFLPDPTAPGLVRTELVSFPWHPGLSISQKQRNVASLHEAAVIQLHLPRLPLEVSTKSTLGLGVSLSAFNLMLPDNDGEETSVEAVFQSSKRFLNGGPFTDLRHVSPRDARSDPRLKQSGALQSFDLDGEVWPLGPPPSFYDWLYLRALFLRQQVMREARCFPAFTDIEFNPAVSMNCQARSLALAIALGDELNSVLVSPHAFRAAFSGTGRAKCGPQLSLDL